MKASKVLLCSRNPVSGVSGGQENRLDVARVSGVMYITSVQQVFTTLTQTPDCKRIRFHQILVGPIRFEYFFRQSNREFSLSYCFIKTRIPNKEKTIVVLITLWEYIKNTFDNNKKYLDAFSFSNELT